MPGLFVLSEHVLGTLVFTWALASLLGGKQPRKNGRNNSHLYTYFKSYVYVGTEALMWKVKTEFLHAREEEHVLEMLGADGC